MTAYRSILTTYLWLPLCCAVILSCSAEDQSRKADEAPPTQPTIIRFDDVTRDAGIQFIHFNGAKGDTYFPEMTGAGGGWLDYDGDGWQDILLINGKRWSDDPGENPPQALYRNLGNGRFADATIAAGLNVALYGMGMAAADFDNDGDTDLYITAVGPNKLFRNDSGVFTDISDVAGLADPSWSTSAMFLDYDRDGWLDLFVCNYVKWSEKTDLWCSLDGKNKGYCTPEVYTGVTSRLYRNQGDGRFADVTEISGVANPSGKSLGVAMLDFNHDGWPDIVVANDTQPDFLYQNNGPNDQGVVTFRDVGLISGMALDESGKARAGMGIDVGTVDDSGEETLFIGHFSNEMIGVYRDLGNGSYVDRAAISQIGNASLLYLTFGLFLFDYDLDADLDLFAVNGHVQPQIEEIQQVVTFYQPPQLFANQGKGNFEDVSRETGGPFIKPIVGRGAAYADYDRDGDLDVLVTSNNGPPLLLRNAGYPDYREQIGHSLRIILSGTSGTRDAIGTRVVAKNDGREQIRWVKTGSSYLSQSELALTFGTGKSKRVDELSVYWPGGSVEVYRNIASDQEIIIREGQGIVSSMSRMKTNQNITQ